MDKAVRRVVVGLVLVALGVAAAAWFGVRLSRDREFRRLLADGDAALASDRHFRAIESFSGAIALRPEVMVGHAKRGETYLRLGDPAAALRDLRQAVDLDPNALRPLELLGDANVALGRHARAAERYQQFLSRDERDARVRYKLGLAHYHAGNVPAAIAELRRASADLPRLGEASYLLGLCFRERGQLTEAIRALERAVELAPDRAPAREALAEAYLRLDRGGDAVAQLEALAAREPERPERHVAVGLAYAAAGQRDAAVIALRRAAERFPEQPAIYTALGRIWLDDADRRGGDRIAVKKALEALAETAARATAPSETLTLYGRALWLDGDIAAAERAFQRATIRFPVDIAAFRWLARTAEQRGHIATARDALSSYLTLSDEPGQAPGDAVRVAELSLRLNEVAVAVTWVRRALPRCQDRPALLARLAGVALGAGDIDSARAAVDRGLALDPQDRGLASIRRRLDGR